MYHRWWFVGLILAAFLMGVGATRAAQTKARASVGYYVLNDGQRLNGNVTVVVYRIDGLVFSKDAGPRMTGRTNAAGNVTGVAEVPLNPGMVNLIQRALR